MRRRWLPAVLAVAIVGAYIFRNNFFDVFAMFVFALIGLLLRRADIPIAPLLEAFILGTSFEKKFRHTVTLSGGEAASNVMGGHVTLVECGVGTPAYMAAKAGKTKIILNLSPGRVPGFPDVPNVEEKGYQFEEINVYGLFTHADAPEAAVTEPAAAFKSVFEESATQEKLKKLGIEPEYFSSKAFRDLCIKAGKSVTGLGEYLKKAKAEGQLK